MAIPLAAILSATPGIISAASDIIKLIRERKSSPKAEAEKLEELESLLEKQALVIEELAVNNRNMALAVRNNRIISLTAVAIALVALLVAVTG